MWAGRERPAHIVRARNFMSASTPTPEKRRRRRTPIGMRSVPYVLVGPAVVLFILVILIPLGYAAYLSVHGLRVTGGGAFGRQEEVFVGLENYISTLTDSELLAGLGRMLIYAIIAVPLLMGTALIFALLLDSPRGALKGTSRIAIFMPYAIPSVIASLMWGFLYLPGTSPLHFIASSVGIELPNPLQGPLIYFAMANLSLWGGLGFNMIILYTALRSIPPELFDAARVDGCTEFQIAMRIKVPHLLPALGLTGLFSILGALQVYSEPTTLKTLTNGITSTFFPLMKVYNEAFVEDDLNQAAATSIVLAIGILLLSLLIQKLFNNRRTQGEAAR